CAGAGRGGGDLRPGRGDVGVDAAQRAVGPAGGPRVEDVGDGLVVGEGGVGVGRTEAHAERAGLDLREEQVGGPGGELGAGRLGVARDTGGEDRLLGADEDAGGADGGGVGPPDRAAAAAGGVVVVPGD